MGHGNHWEAITGDTQEAIKRIIPQACAAGKLMSLRGTLPWPQDGGGVTEATASGIVYPDAALQYLMLIVSKDRENKPENVLASAYPFLREGVETPLRLDDIDEWDPPMEAILEATFADGAVVSFFDPLYFQWRGRHRKQEQHIFSLAGLAYSVKRLEDPKIEVTEGPLLEMHRQEQLKSNPGLDVSTIRSVEVHTGGAAVYFPDQQYRDDACYQGRVEQVDRLEVWLTVFYRMRMKILQLDDSPLRINLYASRAVLGEYVPCPGDDVTGTM